VVIAIVAMATVLVLGFDLKTIVVFIVSTPTPTYTPTPTTTATPTSTMTSTKTPIPSPTITPSNTPTTEPTKQFITINIKVIAGDTGENIDDATVKLLNAVVNIMKKTDNYGVVNFEVDYSQKEQKADLIIEAPRFQNYNRSIILTETDIIIEIIPASTPTPTVTPTSIPTATFAPTPTFTSVPPTLTFTLSDTPVPTLISTKSSSGVFNKPIENVIVSRPTLENIQNLKSIWSLTNFIELQKSGVQTYNVTVTSNDIFGWTFLWCANNKDTLANIMSPLELNILIDDIALETESILEYEKTLTDGWECHYWITELKQWKQKETVKLEFNYYLWQGVNDGETNYPRGQYQQIIYANVK